MLAQLQEEFPEDLRVVFRYFPLIGTPEEVIHDKAALAVQAAEAAGLQGQFWEMHDLLFEKQSEWTDLSETDFSAWLAEEAAELGLDEGQFSEDLQREELQSLAQEAWEAGREIGIPGTPFLLFNQHPLDQNLYSYEILAKLIIPPALLAERQFTECPEITIDPSKDYYATLHTEKGDIEIELFPDVAPIAVNSFVFLINNNWYDNVTFHRVLPDFMAQAGDPSGSGGGSPGYTFNNEIDPDLTFDRAGLVAMANAGPGTNGGQFFITYAPAPHLNGNYTIFGEVVSGMEVVESLTPRNPQENLSAPPGDIILDVSIEVQ